MTTDTLTKTVTPERLPSAPARSESSPNYESRRLPQPIEYPDSDGQPMAESDFQFEPLSYAVESLKIRFQDRPDVYVAGNIFFYYEEGQPAEVVAPDVLVIIGAEKRKRNSVKLWEEKKAPDFVLEITSTSTRGKDQGAKKGVYEFLGVTEYFCYDPTGDYLNPPLIGYRLKDGLYSPIPPKVRTEDRTVVPSETLNLDLHAIGLDFRFVAPESSRVLLNFAETEAARKKAEAQQMLSEAARQYSEAARLKSEAARIEEESARRKAEAERLESQAALMEARTARQEAEARVRELEAQLAALHKSN